MNEKLGQKINSGLTPEDSKRLKRMFRIGYCLFIVLVVGLGLIIRFVKIDITVPADGTLEAENWAEVKAPVAGIIKEVYISESEKVAPGTRLLLLENADLENSYQEAKLAYDTALSKKNKLETEILTTEQQLAKETATTKAKLDSLKIQNPGTISVYEARLEKARVRETQAENDYKKSQDLYEKGVISGQKRDEAQKSWELASADVQVSKRELEAIRISTAAELSIAEAELTECNTRKLGLDIQHKELASIQIEMEKALGQIKYLEEQRSRLDIFSSAQGELLTHRPDQMVGRFVNPGDVLMEIGNPEQLHVNAWLAEEYLPEVRSGLQAKIYLPALPYREYQVFEGVLSQIGSTFGQNHTSSQSSNNESTAYTTVTIKLAQNRVLHNGEEILLKPGMTAQVDIIVRSVGVLDLIWEEVQKIRSRKVRTVG